MVLSLLVSPWYLVNYKQAMLWHKWCLFAVFCVKPGSSITGLGTISIKIWYLWSFDRKFCDSITTSELSLSLIVYIGMGFWFIVSFSKLHGVWLILKIFFPCRKSEIEYYAMLAKTGVHHYNGSNIDLGTACGKYFRVCTLSITDPGK